MRLPRSPSQFSLYARFAVATVVVLGALSGCAVNPLTGEREFVLVSESQEVQMGREADPSIVQSLGLVDDEGWQTYVQELGERMARVSERPDLPWTFRAVDDPVVNAFALPGGFIYVTRGILAHFSSEAELAGVLGHEIGHVTGRHSVQQISRTQLAQLGLGIGTVLAPDLATLAGVAEAGLGLLFLSYGRDDEREADDAGLRYMTGQGYDPSEMAETFNMLADASGASEGGRVPAFLSTHPDPLDRRDRILSVIEQGVVSGSTVERESYLRRLEGLTFGTDPRQGYFEGSTFLHPELAFGFDFPSGWRMANGRDAVQGISAEQDAAIVLSLSEASSPRAGRDAFLAEQGIDGSNVDNRSIGGLVAARADFSANTQDGLVLGHVAFVELGGLVYQIIGYAPEARWSARGPAVRQALASFRRVTDPAVLDAQPNVITLVRTDRGMTLEEFDQRFPSAVSVDEIGTINHLDPGESVPPGTLMKRVVTRTR